MTPSTSRPVGRLPSAGWARGLTAALDVLFPPACSLCERPIGPDRAIRGAMRNVCPACQDDLGRFERPWCDRCGVPVATGADLCRDCGSRAAPFGPIARLRTLGPYEGALARLVGMLKFEGERALAADLAADLAELARSERLDRASPALAYVPMSRARRRARGFNHGRRLAESLAARLDQPVVTELVKTRPTAPQARLSRRARRGNLQGAFAFRPSRPPPECVLLVDDVVTTGATIAACAEALREGGVGTVRAIAVARTPESADAEGAS